MGEGRGAAVGVGQVVSPVLVGRESELSVLVAAVESLPAVAVVEGEAGIGKSRLVAELAAHPVAEGRQWLAGASRRVREPFPLGPVLEALRGVRKALDRGQLSPVSGALRGLLPELAEVLPAAPEPLGDPAAERHRVYRALAEVFAALGDTVLVVEDLHWADEQTADFLAFLVADPPPRLAVLVTYRPAEAAAALRVADTRLPPHVAWARVALGPLDAEQTRALTQAVLDTPRAVSWEFAEYLCRNSSGVPFVIQELLALLRERGQLVRLLDSWTRLDLHMLDVPVRVRDSVLERVERLPEPSRRVLAAAAVLQDATSPAVLAGVCGLSDDDLAAGLEHALGAALLHERDGAIAYRHVLAAQAVHDGLPPTRRMELHARAARTLRDLEPESQGRIAHHLRQAGRMQEWGEAAVAAAEQAARLGDPNEAARLLEDVLRAAEFEPARRGELTVRLGWLATETGHLPSILDLLEGALDHEQPPVVRGQLRFLLLLMHDESGGDPRVRRALAAQAADDLDELPELAAWAMVALGMPLMDEVPPGEHRAWLDRALRTVPHIADPDAAVHVLSKVVMQLTRFGEPRWTGLAERVQSAIGASPRRLPEVNAYLSLANGTVYVGNQEATRRFLDAAAHGRGTPRTELIARWVRVMLDFESGEWSGLAEQARGFAGAMRDRPQYAVIGDTVAAALALADGRVEAARTRLRDLMAVAQDIGESEVLVFPTAAYLRSVTLPGLDSAEPVGAALAESERVFALWRAKRLWPVAVRALPGWVQSLSMLGRTSEAQEWVAEVEEALRGTDAPLAAAALAHARGVLEVARGDVRAAVAEFGTAADEYARLPVPYEAALVRERQAACLLATGAPEGGAALREAVAAYERLGARGDAERARRHMSRLGTGTSAGTAWRDGRRRYGSPLSPRERQVALLAARGLSNKQIAAEFTISVRTVEGHLSTVLNKLGLRTRGDLDLERHARELLPGTGR